MPSRKPPAPDPSVPLTVEVIEIGRLKPDPQNARVHSDRNLDAIKASLARFGQRKPLVVSKSMTVVAGSGTLAAALDLGWTHLSVTVFPGSPTAARAYAIADNRTSELGDWDDARLLAQLDALGTELTVAAGWDSIERDDLARLIEAQGFGKLDRDSEWVGLPEYMNGNLTGAFTATVHFPTDEDAASFFEQLGIPQKTSFWWPAKDDHVGSQSADVLIADE